MAEDFQDLTRRPRRLRRNAPTRAVLQETHVRVEDLIYPLFVKEGESIRVDTRSGEYVERVS